MNMMHHTDGKSITLCAVTAIGTFLSHLEASAVLTYISIAVAVTTLFYNIVKIYQQFKK